MEHKDDAAFHHLDMFSTQRHEERRYVKSPVFVSRNIVHVANGGSDGPSSSTNVSWSTMIFPITMYRRAHYHPHARRHGRDNGHHRQLVLQSKQTISDMMTCSRSCDPWRFAIRFIGAQTRRSRRLRVAALPLAVIPMDLPGTVALHLFHRVEALHRVEAQGFNFPQHEKLRRGSS